MSFGGGKSFLHQPNAGQRDPGDLAGVGRDQRRQCRENRPLDVRTSSRMGIGPPGSPNPDLLEQEKPPTPSLHQPPSLLPSSWVHPNLTAPLNGTRIPHPG